MLAAAALSIAVMCTGTGAGNDNCTGGAKQAMYSVEVVERFAANKDGGALISHVNKSSDFSFNFATAW